MLKKIIFTTLVILLVYLVVRWRQKKTQEIAANPEPAKANTSIYYLAGAVTTLMIVSFIFLFSTQ